MNLNSVMLIGRLGSDPEIKMFENGGKIAIVNLAVNSPYWDENKGHWVPNPDWIRCVFSDKVANRAEELNKGDEILVQGKIKVRSYEDQNGDKKTITEVKGVFKKGRKKSNNEGSQQGQYQDNSPKTEPNPTEQSNKAIPDEEDDLPF